MYWDPVFGYKWQEKLRSLAAKSLAAGHPTSRTQKLERLEAKVRLGQERVRLWQEGPFLKELFHDLGIQLHMPSKCKPGNSYAQVKCRRCYKGMRPLYCLAPGDLECHDVDSVI